MNRSMLPQKSFINFVICLVILFLIQLLVTFNTELFHDEAYYWMYSQYPDWGYFDHPPMVAILIRLGNNLFAGEGGNRILFLILNFSSIFLLYRLLQPKNLLLFTFLIGSCSFFLLYGFLTFPDTPLVFFSLLFFLSYKKYLQNDSVSNSLWMVISMTGMLYSKYHGILILVFTLLSNLRLLKNLSFYWIVFITTLVYIPHLYWQYTHSWAAVKFQLIDRTQSVYKISYFFSYLLQPFILFGLSGIPIFYAAWKTRADSGFEKSLKWNIAGVLCFFLLFSFSRRIEANWTNILSGPFICLAYGELQNNLRLVQKYFRFLFIPTFATYLFALSCFVFDILPSGWNLSSEIHHQKLWSSQIENATRHRPVVFFNSYQMAAKYQFYSGIVSYTLNDNKFRNNQYSFWPIEDSLLGKEVAIIPNWNERSFDSVQTVRGKYSFRIMDHFVSFGRIKIIPEHSSYSFQAGKTSELDFQLVVPDTLYIPYMRTTDATMCYSFFKNGKEFQTKRSELFMSNLSTNKSNTIHIDSPAEPGEYQLNLSIQTGILQPTMNSDPIGIRIY
ncbi:MAG: glycosyltransferase family 39 protein [Bacteroidia bacterium]